MHRSYVAQGMPVFIQRDMTGNSMEIKTKPRMTNAQFLKFCAENRDLRIELDKNKTLIVMPPVDYDGGAREMRVSSLLGIWFFNHKKGEAFSPSTGFTLPDGSMRAADAAWISEENKLALPPSERNKFPKLVPDFVIELRSSSDSLSKLKKKMADTWIKNGVKLAWLIDPKGEKSWVYRADGLVELVVGFDKKLSGEDVCPGFELDLELLKI